MTRQLAALLGMVAVTAGVVALTPPALPDDVPVSILWLPVHHDGWRMTSPGPDDLVQHDVRALETVGRTYAKDGRTVTLWVAQYSSRNDPNHRPRLDLIVPTSEASEVAYGALPVARRDREGTAETVTVNLVSLQRRQGPLTIAYWYHLGGRAVTGDFELRLHLFVDALRARPRRLAAIHVAAEDPGDLADFLDSFYPHVGETLSR